jgi:N-acetylglucosamine-6-phosphate deacetylase
MILKNCTFFNENFEKEFGDIKVENGKIVELGCLTDDGIDMSGKIILPGFVDIHIHGGNGGDFSDGVHESFDKISTYLAKHGVTAFCGTTMTLSHDTLKEIVSQASTYTAPKSKLVGINLEGPYIAMSKKGAQNADFVRAGSIEEFDELYSLNDKIKLITIAPEAFDSDEFIQHVSKKVVVSIGHTASNEQQCRRAIENGVSHATHLFNAMTAMTHREAGTVGAMLDCDNASCELICDGEHICPSVLRNAFDILGEDRACVISDSMRGAGLGTGEFELGGQTAYVKDDYKVAKLKDGTIAASITNVLDEFKNLLSFGIDFKTALKSCTINPAKVIKEDKNIGSIAIGKSADLIVTDENLNITEVYINGTLA